MKQVEESGAAHAFRTALRILASRGRRSSYDCKRLICESGFQLGGRIGRDADKALIPNRAKQRAHRPVRFHDKFLIG
ncbi:MAG TPA: hypothetical protein VGG45_19070 [Terracidiphilus sp.]